MSHECEHPTLHWHDPKTGDELAFHFGYWNDEPTAALFVGDADDPVMIPREALLEALKGWSMECPICAAGGVN